MNERDERNGDFYLFAAFMVERFKIITTLLMGCSR
jgi:hypothetical protein